MNGSTTGAAPCTNIRPGWPCPWAWWLVFAGAGPDGAHRKQRRGGELTCGLRLGPWAGTTRGGPPLPRAAGPPSRTLLCGGRPPIRALLAQRAPHPRVTPGPTGRAQQAVQAGRARVKSVSVHSLCSESAAVGRHGRGVPRCYCPNAVGPLASRGARSDRAWHARC